jgi:hypothetical protein
MRRTESSFAMEVDLPYNIYKTQFNDQSLHSNVVLKKFLSKISGNLHHYYHHGYLSWPLNCIWCIFGVKRELFGHDVVLTLEKISDSSLVTRRVLHLHKVSTLKR